MGFFGDLKQDLSQAVNELIPDEPVAEPEAESISLAEVAASLPDPDESEEGFEDLDMDALLAEAEKIANEREAGTAEAAAEEPVIEEPVVAEPVQLSLDDMIAAATEPVTEEEVVVEEAVAETPAEEFVIPEDLVIPEDTAVSEEITIPDEPIAVEEPIIADEPIAVEEPIIADEPVIEEAVTTEEPAAEDLALDEVFADIEASQTAGAMAAAAAMEQEPVMETEEIQTEDYMNKGAESTMDSMRDYSEETSVITGGMRISGDVTTEGSLDLVGSIAGDVTVNGKLNVTGHIIGNSKAKEVFAENAKITGDVVSESSVKVGAGTVIVGNITATSAAIAGAVKGDIDVKGPVILDSTAIVMGNIRSKSVQINNGAAIEGNCSQCYADVSPTAFFEEYKVEKKAAKAEKAAK